MIFFPLEGKRHRNHLITGNKSRNTVELERIFFSTEKCRKTAYCNKSR